MRLVDTTCPSCGATMSVDQENQVAFCQYCGAKLLVDDEVRRTRLDDAEETGYLFELGRQRAIAEAAAAREATPAPPEATTPSEPMPQKAYPTSVPQAPAQKGRKTWLWALGWIFCFPIPLAVLIMRHFEQDPDVEINAVYVLRAVLWLMGWVYVFPIPLTILMLRNDSLSRPVRIAVTAVGWLTYLFIFVASSRS